MSFTVIVSMAFDLGQIGRPCDEDAVARLAEAVVGQVHFNRLGAEDERARSRFHHLVVAHYQPHHFVAQPVVHTFG